MGKTSLEVNEVPDPKILNDRDAIIRITSSAICGSDLHLYDGYIPTMDMCDIKPGDVIAVWGAGPVGQFAVASAKMLGAERVIAIDRFPYRLAKAKEAGATDLINYEEAGVLETLADMTAGRGPDGCIDAVGMEAHHANPAVHAYDRTKQATRLETERPHALREAVM